MFVRIHTWLTLQNVNQTLIMGPRLKWKPVLHNEIQILVSEKFAVSYNKNQELQPGQPPSLHKYQFSLFLLLAEEAWQWHATTLLVNTRYYKHRTEIIITVKKKSRKELRNQPTPKKTISGIQGLSSWKCHCGTPHVMLSATPL